MPSTTSITTSVASATQASGLASRANRYSVIARSGIQDAGHYSGAAPTRTRRRIAYQAYW